MRGKFISYLRVSTDKQGVRGHGLDAQRKAVTDYLNGGSWELLDEFVEIESGKRNDRPKLAEALAACKKHRARLVIAKLDRLSRNVSFISNLMDGKVDFVCCDFPSANRLTLHILAAVAEHEREMISERTKAGLAAAKAKGKTLGKYSKVLSAKNAADAAARDSELESVLRETANISSRDAAAEIERRGLGKISYMTVQRARARLDIKSE